MNPKFLIEDFDPDGNLDRLVEEIKSQGFEYKLVSYVPFGGGKYDVFGDNECVLFIGTLNLANQILRDKGDVWFPSCWLNLKKYKCTNYYPKLGKYLFNEDYMFLPFAEFERNLDFCLEVFGIDGCMFIRPDSGYKTFSGRLITEEKLRSKPVMAYMKTNVDPEDLIQVSYPRKVLNEWRFVVADGKIITGSLYKTEGVIRQEIAELNTPQAKLAQVIANERFDPDPMYTIDICEAENHEFKLLEIGSFCCAGMYSSDYGPIVEHASRLALQEYEDMQL